MSETLPAILEQEVTSFLAELPDDLVPLVSTPEAKKVLACSQFVADYCLRNPDKFRKLIKGDELLRSRRVKGYSSRFKKVLEGVDEEVDLMRVMRQFRNREMVRIAWRDISGLAELEETTENLSLLAEVMLDQVMAWLYERLAKRFGKPLNEAGEAQQMVIIAMGKLGAHELNFSSDIDLIFVFPEAGETDDQGDKKSLDNQEFFIRLGKKLIKVFNEITEDGFVFRMDMRLRPFGESGALALNFDAMEEYYVSHARDWERYALIKANIAAGDKVAGAELINTLTPFVFRRYLDFGAYHAIREMKIMIDREVLRKGMASDVKLGAGGIREIEFIGQTFQLLRGGREPKLQTRKILRVLEILDNIEILNKETTEELRNAYIFLRNTEHRIQEISDQQTQALPTSELDQARVAIGMGFENWQVFLTSLDRHRIRVNEHFAQLLRTPDEEELEPDTDLLAIWRGQVDTDVATTQLQLLGFVESDQIVLQLEQIRQNKKLQNQSKEGVERLDRLMPAVLKTIAAISADDQLVTFERVLKLIESVARRSVYLSLLKEYPQALARLVKLCAASPWIADYISSQPILLDELIDRDSLYSPPNQHELSQILHDQLIHLPESDLERQMDTLRHFRHSQVLRVAAADITGQVFLKEVSNHLSAIAEVVLVAAMQLVQNEMAERYGEPTYKLDGKTQIAQFTVIAYGKLGGLELGYSSDLDVVFLHNSCGEQQISNGKKEVDNSVFFNRFGQRLIHLLTAITPAGKTYEIDTRLRPSGLSGFLVTGIDAFADYQKNKAWTWEHQALVRARPVAGDDDLQADFFRVRNEILAQPRDQQSLKTDVREMREKMRDSLLERDAEIFDLKQGVGGMADIEFIVQYNVLRWASDHKELLVHTDNLRLLETLAELEILPSQETTLLKEAYFSYRTSAHRLALLGKSSVVAESDFHEYRDGVTKIWKQQLEN